jgi:hypothetical protein
MSDQNSWHWEWCPVCHSTGVVMRYAAIQSGTAPTQAVHDNRQEQQSHCGIRMNLALVTLIAEYCEWTEREAEGLLLHLEINGWTVVPIPEPEKVNG